MKSFVNKIMSRKNGLPFIIIVHPIMYFFIITFIGNAVTDVYDEFRYSPANFCSFSLKMTPENLHYKVGGASHAVWDSTYSKKEKFFPSL